MNDMKLPIWSHRVVGDNVKNVHFSTRFTEAGNLKSFYAKNAAQ